MIATIIITAIAFGWLGLETNWLTVRLPIGRMILHDGKARTMAQWDAHNKLFAKEIEQEQNEFAKREATRKSHTCPICNKYDENVLADKKELHIGNSVCHVIGCPDCIAKYTKDVISSQIYKPRQPTIKTTPLPLFIKQVRVGSHQEFVPRIDWKTGKPDESGKGFHQTVEEFSTVYHDCLVPKEWLKEHEHDLDNYEPTIEVSIDDKILSVNGNYQKGMIGSFVSQYTQKVKVGRKSIVTIKEVVTA